MGHRNLVPLVPLVPRHDAMLTTFLAEADNDAVRALRQLDDNIETAKREMGIMAFYTGGSVHSHALIDETRLALRVALGLSTI